MIDNAIQARERAYAPYSKFKVGALLVVNLKTKDKEIVVKGCNIENASYGLTICAERNAIWKFISEFEFDKQNIESSKIIVITDMPVLTPPCGACRQVMQEFFPNIQVILTNTSKDIISIFEMKDLLPNPFDVSNLS